MIYAIGDFHLGLLMDKPMDRFGAAWANHHEQIAANWRAAVTENDTVILAGDTSWAMDMEGFTPDLQFIQALPGRKIIVQGNHDYWWGSTNKLNTMDERIYFLKCGCTKTENVHICGARGWLCPNDTLFTQHDQKIYMREAARLRLSLDAAMRDGAEEIIVAMHFPPMNDRGEASAFTELLAGYPVRMLVYGHLHGEGGFMKRVENENGQIGKPDGIACRLVSCDYLRFAPLLVWPIPHQTP